MKDKFNENIFYKNTNVNMNINMNMNIPIIIEELNKPLGCSENLM
jgi:hypothetical protein